MRHIPRVGNLYQLKQGEPYELRILISIDKESYGMYYIDRCEIYKTCKPEHESIQKLLRFVVLNYDLLVKAE